MTQVTPENLEEVIEDYFDVESVGPFKVVSDKEIDTTRWESIRQLVWREEDKYFAVDYAQGLTEMQDSDNRYITVKDIYEVEPVEVKKTHYISLK